MKLIIILLAWVGIAQAAPVLNFSDITIGPKTGNTDGVGSGAIVTIWGNNLGSTQGASKVYVGSVEATAIYYWKDADGQLPGGPADLKTFHKMQEIAFAVPAGAVDGANTIKVTVGGTDSNTLPFTVRTGNIRFIKSGGSNGNTGTWSSPWGVLNNNDTEKTGVFDSSIATTGDIVYSVGVGTPYGVRLGAVGSLTGTFANPIAFVSYPNSRVEISGRGGDDTVIDNWYPNQRVNEYITISKIKIVSSGATGNCNLDSTNGVSVDNGFRVVGLEISGPTVFGGSGGAVTASGSNGAYAGNVQAYGLYIHNYGQPTAYSYNPNEAPWTTPYQSCYYQPAANGVARTGVDSQQHLFYISNRTDTIRAAYEIGWCHLTDNPILHGIHIYDTGSIGGWSGTMRLHHNVVKNQRGAAFDASFSGPGTIEFYNNLIIHDVAEPYNHGPAFDLLATNASIKVYNNTVQGYSAVNIIRPGTSDYRNNIMIDDRGVQFMSDTPTTHSNNLFYSTGATSQPTWAGAESGHITGNPLFTNAAIYDFTLQSNSPAKDAGYNTTVTVATDLLGGTRSTPVDIGAFEYGSYTLPTETPKATRTKFNGFHKIRGTAGQKYKIQ